MEKDEFGVFQIVLPAVNGQPAIPHDSKIKVSSSTYMIGVGLNLDRSHWSFQTIMQGKRSYQPG
jgi:hypothetical protein